MTKFITWAVGFCILLLAVVARTETIDRDRIRQDLAPESTEFEDLEARFNPAIHYRGKSLIISDFLQQGNYRSARVFSKLFGKRYGLGAWLNASWHGLPTAGYNGIAFDRDQRPVANVKFGELNNKTPFFTEQLSTRFIEKMNKYHRPERWTEYVLRLVRSDLGFDRQDENIASFELNEPLLTNYRNYVAITRRMMKFFDVGGPREGWLVFRVDGISLLDEEIEALKIMMKHSPVVRGIILMERARILTLSNQGTHVDEFEPCESRLVSGERSFHVGRQFPSRPLVP